ncbi:30S ribosomal protein S16 [Planctomicrobium sp. SH668]|uniref:30S ribosomal protein S16 n=1 Tax=Planctomicrobium sp. SH668 TaxID=3448126 RepID=UPI003F5CB7D3
MAVRIRMKRMGRTHRPFYRICVIDQRKARDAKAIEEIGTYDPMVQDKSKRVTLKMDRVEHWVSVGAQPSERVATLIRKVKENDWGAIKSPPPMQAPQVKAAPAAEEAPAEEAAAE